MRARLLVRTPFGPQKLINRNRSAEPPFQASLSIGQVPEWLISYQYVGLNRLLYHQLCVRLGCDNVASGNGVLVLS
jgi:hypothetical protein